MLEKSCSFFPIGGGLRVGSNLLCADNFSDDGTSISGTCDLSETTDGNDFVFFNAFAGNSFNFDSDLFELFPKFLLLSASSFNNNDLTGFDGFFSGVTGSSNCSSFFISFNFKDCLANSSSKVPDASYKTSRVGLGSLSFSLLLLLVRCPSASRRSSTLGLVADESGGGGAFIGCV